MMIGAATRTHHPRRSVIFFHETERSSRVSAPATDTSRTGAVKPPEPPNGLVQRAPRFDEPSPAGTIAVKGLAQAGLPPFVALSKSRTEAPKKATLAPKDATEAEKFAHYEAIVKANGGTIKDGERHVLGIRGLGIDGKTHETTSNRSMNDVMVVLWRDSKGGVHVREMAGSTHSGPKSSKLSPDANKDGTGDVGMIRPGSYRVTPNGPFKDAPSYLVQTTTGSSRIPGVRDTDHDGVFSTSEDQASRKRNDTLSAVLFHRGNGDRVSSIGCQNALDWSAFVAAVGGPRASFDYTLVEA